MRGATSSESPPIATGKSPAGTGRRTRISAAKHLAIFLGVDLGRSACGWVCKRYVCSEFSNEKVRDDVRRRVGGLVYSNRRRSSRSVGQVRIGAIQSTVTYKDQLCGSALLAFNELALKDVCTL